MATVTTAAPTTCSTQLVAPPKFIVSSYQPNRSPVCAI